MPTRFYDLPYELREHIFELAAKEEFHPRVVEIFCKDGEIYSRSPPPPLLHVCHESRNVTLKIYKPWLLQFEGTANYKLWTHIMKKSSLKDKSRLNNFCISLEHDTLLMRGRSSNWQLGPIELYNLRQLTINVTGWVVFASLRSTLRRFKSLERLYIFDEKDGPGIDFKRDRIQQHLRNEEAKDKKEPRKRIPNYRAPKVVITSTPPLPAPWGVDKLWTSYRYPRHYKSIVDFLEGCLEEETPEPPEMFRPKKRAIKSEDEEEERPRKKAQSAKNKRRSLQDPRREDGANAIGTGGLSRTGDQPRRRPDPVYSNTSQSPEPEDVTRSRSPSVATSDEILLQLNEEINEARSTRSSTGSFFDVEDIEDADVERKVDGDKDEIKVEEEDVPTPELASASRDTSPLYVVERFVAERQTPGRLEILVQWEGYPDEEDWTWERAKSLAESVPSMVEEWNGRADQSPKEDEEDEEKDACEIQVVEKILGRRKVNGIPHYLVKWVGYDQVKDRNWEPCEKLQIDVPFVVEEYEAKRRKR